MTSTPKKHHFVTQAQLRHFAADGARRSVFVFDKASSRSFRTAILNAGSENNFNTVTFDGAKWVFEHLFQDVDDRSASLIAKINNSRSLASLSPDDRVALSDFVATQLVRTHFVRTTPIYIAESLRQMTRQIGYDPDLDPAMAMPSDAELRLGAVRAFLERNGLASALQRLHPALYTVAGKERFVISDHPVCLDNAFPYGDEALTSHGIRVYVPISPELTLALHCPTVVHRYELAESMPLEPAQGARMRRYLSGLRSGEPIEFDDGTVPYLNALQVVRSARYLYASQDDFDFARKIVDEQPQLRSVSSHIEAGGIGAGLPPRSGMPTGTNLVILGRSDHCMLKIEELDEAGEGITARTRQVDLLAQVTADTGMLHVQLYVDRRCTREMRETMVEMMGQPSDGWFRVVHRDPGLRRLGAKTSARGDL